MPSVDGGVLSPRGARYVVVAIPSGKSDANVSVDFRSIATRPVVALALRVADADNLLLLRYSAHFREGRLELVRRVNGEFKVITMVSVGPLDTSTAHRLEARMTGSSIIGLWDGVAKFETRVNDNQFSGLHGLFWDTDKDQGATYDNFSVTTEVIPPALSSGTVCEAQLSHHAVYAGSGNGTATMDVVVPSGCAWTARMLYGNATINGTFPRSGPDAVQFQLANNSDIYPRLNYASVAGQLVTIVQAGLQIGECNYDVLPGQLSFSAEPDVRIVHVGAIYDACRRWTVTSNRDWITINDGSLRDGIGSVLVSVTKNLGRTTRSGHLIVGPMTILVQQAPEMCDFTVNPTSIPVNASEMLTSDNQSVYATVTAPNDCGWEAVSDSHWLHVTENPEGSGTQTIRIYVENNPQPFPRSGKVLVRKTGWTPVEINVRQQDGPGADPGGEYSYIHTDILGSVRLITDGSGNVLNRYDYLPFGQEWQTQHPNYPNAVRFAGRERDTETGSGAFSALDYFMARYYQSQAGRFTTVDPGHVGGNILNPQSLNGYSYALNNPLRFVDPLGACSQDANGNYIDGDDAGTLVSEGPCPKKKGALTAGASEHVSVKAKPAPTRAQGAGSTSIMFYSLGAANGGPGVGIEMAPRALMPPTPGPWCPGGSLPDGWFNHYGHLPTVGRDGTSVPTGGRISMFIESLGAAGHAFGTVHDRMVGDLKASGWSDRRANILSMPGAYALIVYALFQNGMNRIQGEPPAFLICH